MSLLTGRVTVNDNNGEIQVPLSQMLIWWPPFWFYCADPTECLPSHVFCCVEVVIREHPGVGKHLNMITSDRNPVVGNSLLSHVGLIFTV